MTGTQEPQAISLAALKSALSEPRLEAYRLNAEELPETVLGRYRWNIALGISFQPALHLLEVALRNNLHRVITQHCGTDRWYDLTPGVLTSYEQKRVGEAKAQLHKDEKAEEPDRLVAELSFAFWTGLLSTAYEQKFWPRLLSSAFPHMPRKERTRQKVAERLGKLRLLRNRISHHEPIFRLNLVRLYEELQEAIRWISPNLRLLLPIGEGFADVFGRGCTAYEIRISVPTELSV